MPDGLSPRQKIATILAVAAAAVAGTAGFVFWQRGRVTVPPPVSLGTSTPPIEEAAVRPPRHAEPQPAAIPPYGGEPVHVLRADSEVVRQVGEAILLKSKAELADLAVKLAANPASPDDWMRVASIKRLYHDYTGARDAYEYLNVIAPGVAVAFHNLGILYGYYLKEPARAIPKYERAIALEPGGVDHYLEFASFWREVMRNTAEAEKVLLAGLAKLPRDASLAAAAGALYQSLGNAITAIEYYELARSAHPPGSPAYAAINRELEELRQAPVP